MNFRTYGPFEVAELSPEGIRKLFADFEVARKGLGKAIGIYIVAAPDHAGDLIPWYVGKSDKNWGGRLRNHFDAAKFHTIMKEYGGLSVVLIPRVTGGGKLKQVTEKMREGPVMKSIDRLEFDLIRDCFRKNPKILNKSQRVFHSTMYVPGYWNDKPEEREDSAKQLAKMLQPKV